MAKKKKVTTTKKVVVPVYVLKQAEKVHNKWQKSFAVVQREGLKLSEEAVKAYNANYETTGSYYELVK